MEKMNNIPNEACTILNELNPNDIPRCVDYNLIKLGKLLILNVKINIKKIYY